jgi:hypothetical protein
MSLKISTHELEQFFKNAINHLKKLNIEEVEIGVDEYLLISTSDWEKFDQPYNPITESLLDDIISLRKVQMGELPTSFVDFDRIAALLRGISETLNPGIDIQSDFHS